MFQAATVPELLPSRAFPSRRSRAPLGVACSLAVIHRCALRPSRPDLVPRGFTDSHAVERSRLDPLTKYGSPFSRPEPASRSPWVEFGTDAANASFTRLEALIPPSSPFASDQVSQA
jgi:hypothetical protein